MRKTTFVALAAAAALAISALPDLEATCGGGGGGGRGGMQPPQPPPGGAPGGQQQQQPPVPQIYSTTWASSLESALAASKEGKKPIVLYFQAEKQPEHNSFKSKMMSDWSKLYQFLKFDYKEEDPVREEYNVDKRKHELHVCDWHGNSVKMFEASGSQEFPYSAIQETLSNLEKLVDRMIKDAESKAKNAEGFLKKNNFNGAAKLLGPYASLKGHDVAAKIKEIFAAILQEVEKEIGEALKAADNKGKAKALNSIKAKYKGAGPVESRCDEELKKITGQAPPVERAPSAGELAWQELFDGIDFAKRPPLIAERAHRAMAAGLGHELAERYEQALEQYALAAGLDARDPIPLIYLGELYRHHFGRWDDARKVFERVLELDNDDYAVAIALHGIGKMTIWSGDNEKGVKMLEASIRRCPNTLAYRNLAVFWNTEGESKKAMEYATRAYLMQPDDPYNQVFFAVYLHASGRPEEAKRLADSAAFDKSHHYNLACLAALQGRRDAVIKHLRAHFYDYERYDDVRRFEMAEARMDILFKPYFDDPEFKRITALAAR
jgi:tetratricopeptide (TPR) repeat protein